MTGMPVAFCFIVVNILGILLFWGGLSGLGQLGPSIFSSLTSFVLGPVVLFVLMGELMFRSGIAPQMIDTIDMWLGRLPGRLSLIAVGAGTLLGALTGAEFATIAILGKGLRPEMERRGYKKAMILGPIMGSGGLAILIPPSDVAVILGALGKISVGKLLMAIIMPGLLVAALFAIYIIPRCIVQPSLAPSYEIPPTPVSKKLLATAKYILPVGIILFLVIGVIFIGVTTPTEAAATGALGMCALAAAYKKLSIKTIKESITGTLEISIMVFFIMSGAGAFSQVLAYTGATVGLIEYFLSLPVEPIFILIGTQIVVLILGMFMNILSIMMITLPLFMPVVNALGFNPVWFGVMMLINLTIASISPPFGLSLFVMKGVASPDTTMGDIYRASLPWVILNIIAIGMVMAFPQIALWLPSQMWH